MAKRRKSPLLPFLLILLLIQCIFLPANSLANYLTVSWTPTTEPDPAGNQVYYGTASREYVYSTDVGEINAYRLDDLLDGVPYFTAVTAYDISGNESDFSNGAPVMVNDTPSSSTTAVKTGSEDGYTEWGCFIATAVFSSSWEPHVRAPCDFSDHYLGKSQLGRSFTRDYYRHSPFIAQNIETNPSLKATLKMSPAPLVILSQFLVRSTLTDKIVYFLFVLCYSLCIFSWLLKNNPGI